MWNKIVLLFFLVVTSCGGGGGGSSSTNSSGLRVINGVIDGAPVVINSSTIAFTKTFSFWDRFDYQQLNEGVHEISVSGLSSNIGVFDTENFEYQNGQQKTLFVFGGVYDSTYQAELINNENELSAKNATGVLLYNSVVGTNSVLVEVFDQSLNLNLGETIFFEASSLVGLLSVSNQDNSLIYQGEFSLTPGRINNLLLTGEDGYLVLAKLF